MVVLLVALGVISVALSVIGPKILGHATDLIFAGVVGQRLPAGISKAQAIAEARARGDGRFADLLSGTDVVPGSGIDFAALGRVLVLVLLLYVTASIFMWAQGYLVAGVVQRTVYRLRSDVEAKLNRLPLSYFDKQPRGEILSRVTNDIDNLGQSLQQTMSQLLTSLLTVIGVLTVMVVISPLLAVVALCGGSLFAAHHPGDRQAIPAEVPRPVAKHGRAQRPDRRGVHRPLDRQGVRAPA